MIFKKLGSHRALCYVLVFDQPAIIEQSLRSLTRFSGQLEIVVIENPSARSPEIGRLIDSFGQRKLIDRYYKFEKNITGMAYDVVISKELAKVKKSSFVIVTDGDLTCDDNWLEEEKDILLNNQLVFACGTTLDKSNLPIKAFPEAANWIPADIGVLPDYYEACTGGHLLMFRGDGLARFMKWKDKNRMLFLDSHMHKYCYENLKMKWARTKHSLAYHLTWDLYQDKSHPYTQLKLGKNFDETWRHNRIASYQLRQY